MQSVHIGDGGQDKLFQLYIDAIFILREEEVIEISVDSELCLIYLTDKFEKDGYTVERVRDLRRIIVTQTLKLTA